MQKRFWDFKADDLSASLNRWYLGILPMGLYFGFDPKEIDGSGNLNAADLFLRLNQLTTGQKESDADNNFSGKIGKFMAPQGIVIAEELDEIVVPIGANATAHKRIDLIVATTEYVTIEGGAEVVYSVVQGIAALNPVAPAIPFPETQTLIGTVVVGPGVTTSLSQAVCTFTRPNYLTLGNRPDTFAYIDREQAWEYLQTFKSLSYGEWKEPVVIDGELRLTDKSGLYKLTETEPLSISTIAAPYLKNGSVFFLEASGKVTIQPGGATFKTPGDVDFIMQAGDIIPCLVENPDIGTFIIKIIARSDYASINRNSAFKKLVSFSDGEATWADSKLTVGDINYVYYGSEGAKNIDLLSIKPDVTQQTIKNIGIANLTFRNDQVTSEGFGKMITIGLGHIVVKPLQTIDLYWKGGIAYVVGGTFMTEPLIQLWNNNTAWTPITLTADCDFVGIATTHKLSYRRINGDIVLRGRVRRISPVPEGLDTLVGVLPNGFRPLFQSIRELQNSPNGGIRVESNGEVYIDDDSATTPTTYQVHDFRFRND
jgi:hypothetical protein